MPPNESHLKVIGIKTFLEKQIPPREMVLAPVLAEQGLILLYAERGLGKTYTALSMAHAIATGGEALGWKAPKARPVLYIDGEMPGVILQERLKEVTAGTDQVPSDDFFRLLAATSQTDAFINIGIPKGQAMIEPALEGVEVIIIDNLSTLCSYGKENEAESWEHVQSWLLQLRNRGISVVLVHHAGKNGHQRGTSRREDVLDTVIKLKRPTDYSPDQGARFEVHIEKNRGFIGNDAAPFEAQLVVEEGKASWRTGPIIPSTLKQIMDIYEEGMSVRDIAQKAGVSKSTAHRLKGQIPNT